MNEDSIQQIKETKNNKFREKLLNGINNINDENLKESDNKLAIPSHRKYKYITFEEYKEYVRNNENLDGLYDITSSHLINFYNFLAQGKNTLSKENFIKEYESGVSLEEISKKYKIQREFISKLRDFYGIKRKGANFLKRINNEKPLSQETKEIIIGSVLGDGHISGWGYLSEKHSEKQKDYILWKSSFFKEISTEKLITYDEYFEERYNKIIKSYILRTRSHSFIYEIADKFYKEIDNIRIKIIPDNIKEYLTPLSLAVWFMDDGTTSWPHRKGIKTFKNSKPTAKICTDCFTIEDINKLILAIKENFNIQTSILNHYKNMSEEPKPRIFFNTNETQKLFELIKPFVHQNLKYKIDEEAYVEYYKKKIEMKAI